MKVNEIVREERLDEIAPLAAVGGMGAIFSAVMFGLKAYSVYEMYDVLSKNGYDIDNMSDDDRFNLFLTFVTLFVPGGGKTMNSILMKYMPDWARRRAIKMVADKLAPMADDLRKMKNENRKKYKNTAGTSPKQAAKNAKDLAKDNKALTAQYQAVGRQLAAEKLKDVVYPIVGGLALLPLAYTYYGKLDELDKEYSAHKEGDRTTEIFGEMDDTQAWKEYQKLRTKYIGELTVGVTSALSRTPVVKKLDALNRLIGKAASAVGGKLVGGLIKLPIGTITKIAKVGGPGLTVLMQTEEGQKFLSNSIVETIVGGIGSISSTTLNLLASAADKVLGLAGIKTDIRGAVQGQAPSPNVQMASDLEKKYNTPNTARDLYVTFDPNNTKLISIGGIKMTDAHGFLLPGTEQYVTNLGTLAKSLGQPNPIETLNLKFR